MKLWKLSEWGWNSGWTDAVSPQCGEQNCRVHFFLNSLHRFMFLIATSCFTDRSLCPHRFYQIWFRYLIYFLTFQCQNPTSGRSSIEFKPGYFCLWRFLLAW